MQQSSLREASCAFWSPYFSQEGSWEIWENRKIRLRCCSYNRCNTYENRLSNALPFTDTKVPPNFSDKAGKESHDFAMYILEREITFTDTIRPICIPRQVCIMVGPTTMQRFIELQNQSGLVLADTLLKMKLLVCGIKSHILLGRWFWLFTKSLYILYIL